MGLKSQRQKQARKAWLGVNVLGFGLEVLGLGDQGFWVREGVTVQGLGVYRVWGTG